MRYIATVNFYIYAKTDKEAKEQVKNMRDFIAKRDDNQAKVISLCEAKFGKIKKGREVK